MNLLKTTDIYGKDVEVDMDSKTLMDYDNDKREIEYSVKIVENGKLTDFSTDIHVEGTIDDVEERIKTWNNVVRLEYAFLTKGNASKNDPDQTIRNKFIEYVKENPEKFFTKSGNWRKDAKIDPKEVVQG